jgi:GxxExxY protein
MDTNKHEFTGPLAKEAFEIVGCAFEVLNELGSGLLEKPYDNAFVVEFGFMKYSIQTTTSFSRHL